MAQPVFHVHDAQTASGCREKRVWSITSSSNSDVDSDLYVFANEAKSLCALQMIINNSSIKTQQINYNVLIVRREEVIKCDCMRHLKFKVH